MFLSRHPNSSNQEWGAFEPDSHACQEGNPLTTGQRFHPSQFDLSRRRHCFRLARNGLSSKWNPSWGCRCRPPHCPLFLAFLSWCGRLQIQRLFEAVFSLGNTWSRGKWRIIRLKGWYFSFEKSLRKCDSGERKAYLPAQKVLHGTKLVNARMRVKRQKLKYVKRGRGLFDLPSSPQRSEAEDRDAFSVSFTVLQT